MSEAKNPCSFPQTCSHANGAQLLPEEFSNGLIKSLVLAAGEIYGELPLSVFPLSREWKETLENCESGRRAFYSAVRDRVLRFDRWLGCPGMIDLITYAINPEELLHPDIAPRIKRHLDDADRGCKACAAYIEEIRG